MAAQEAKTRKNAKARRQKKTDAPASEERGRSEGGQNTVAEGGGLVARVRKYLVGVLAESKRVTWPSKAELMAGTLVTFFTLVMFAGYLGVLDKIFERVLQF